MASIRQMHLLQGLLIFLLLLHGWVIISEGSWERYWSRVERVMVP